MGKTFPAHSLNMMLKTLTLTVVHWTKTLAPPTQGILNSNKSGTAGHLTQNCQNEEWWQLWNDVPILICSKFDVVM